MSGIGKTLLCIKIWLTLWIVLPVLNTQARETWNFNGGWFFAVGDHADYGSPELSVNKDSYQQNWLPVNLPHSFSIPYFMSSDFYVGPGWYRKKFQVSKDIEYNTDRWFLEFDGVFQTTDIYVNGEKAGSHIGGYTGFTIDITGHLRPGDNMVAVRVDNTWQPDVAPRAGEHTFSGGIYRNVRLVRKSDTSIDWCGTSVSTPRLAVTSGEDGTVDLVTQISKFSLQEDKCRLVSTIFDESGRKVACSQTEFRMAPHDKVHSVNTRCRIKKPRLWSVESPVRYHYVNELYREDKLIDSDEGKFGFRWFEWTADKGFRLNGHRVHLHGANVHQDHAGWGDAVTDAGARRDVAMMKDAGFNFIRGSHYPHSPAFSEACDSLGILYWSEAPFWGIGGFKSDGYWNSSAYPAESCQEEAFEASALNQLEEMIRIHRNHPSIVVWSMCNEAFFSAAGTMEGVKRLLRRMVELSHRLDPTRPAAVGGVQRPLGDNRIDKIGDVAGYNGDGAMLPDFIDPGIPSMVSEYGSVSTDRPGEYDPGWRCLADYKDWQNAGWRAGYAVWCGFDHGSIAGSQLGKMGIVDYFRIPKRAWYWYRNANLGIAPPKWQVEGTPVKLRLEGSAGKTVQADGTDDVQLIISVLDASGRELSNCPDVTLRIVAGPGEFPTGRSITFSKDSDIRIQDGKAAIEMRAYQSGVAEIEAASPGLESAYLTIEFVDGINSEFHGVSDRPYVRYERMREKELLTFGQNNPMFASSSKDEHVSGYAGDGLPDTFWQSDNDDLAPIITLDTEKGIRLERVSLQFPTNKVWKYRIDSSRDGSQWFPICDHTDNDTPCSSVIHTCANEKRIQFIRISFVGQGAVSELSASGYIID